MDVVLRVILFIMLTVALIGFYASFLTLYNRRKQYEAPGGWQLWVPFWIFLPYLPGGIPDTEENRKTARNARFSNFLVIIFGIALYAAM